MSPAKSSLLGRLIAVGCAGALPLATGCGRTEDPGAAPPAPPPKATLGDLPVPADPRLLAGKAVWEVSCQKCHLNGRAGAPRIFDQAAWAARLEKSGRDTLVEHAIHGTLAPSGAEMPARGGVPELTDQQVTEATDYVIAVSQGEIPTGTR